MFTTQPAPSLSSPLGKYLFGLNLLRQGMSQELVDMKMKRA